MAAGEGGAGRGRRHRMLGKVGFRGAAPARGLLLKETRSPAAVGLREGSKS